MQVITDPAKPAIEVITGFGVELRGPEAAKPSSSRSACELFQEAIQLGLSRGRNARAIWQDLVSDHGLSAGYQSVRRYIYALRGPQTPQTPAVILTAPGEEAQLGQRAPMVREPQSGKYRRTRLFVMTLGYSRKAIRLLTFRSSTRICSRLHDVGRDGSCAVYPVSASILLGICNSSADAESSKISVVNGQAPCANGQAPAHKKAAAQHERERRQRRNNETTENAVCQSFGEVMSRLRLSRR
jgi:hypothetical protein